MKNIILSTYFLTMMHLGYSQGDEPVSLIDYHSFLQYHQEPLDISISFLSFCDSAKYDFEKMESVSTMGVVFADFFAKKKNPISSLNYYLILSEYLFQFCFQLWTSQSFSNYFTIWSY